ncbi:hypothetical protein [Maritalea sp. S77]|uniref:hypothetical protein n=1 Tax=Maritalea sp. S77 TaxID=3415125 RepID=UPI003C7EAE53
MTAHKSPAERFHSDAEPHIRAARDFVDLLAARLGQNEGLSGLELRAFSRLAIEAQAELVALETSHDGVNAV